MSINNLYINPFYQSKKDTTIIMIINLLPSDYSNMLNSDSGDDLDDFRHHHQSMLRRFEGWKVPGADVKGWC